MIIIKENLEHHELKNNTINKNMGKYFLYSVEFSKLRLMNEVKIIYWYGSKCRDKIVNTIIL